MTKESNESIFYKIGGKGMVQSGRGKLKLKTKKEKCGRNSLQNRIKGTVPA